MLCRVHDAYQCCEHGGDQESAQKWLGKVLEEQLLSDDNESEDIKQLTKVVESSPTSKETKEGSTYLTTPLTSKDSTYRCYYYFGR